LYEEKGIGKNHWVRAVSREGSDDRSYRITIPKELGDKYGFDKYVRVEEHPTEEAIIIKKV
jgi:hypothetical protein